jgi:hypothetical protein
VEEVFYDIVGQIIAQDVAVRSWKASVSGQLRRKISKWIGFRRSSSKFMLMVARCESLKTVFLSLTINCGRRNKTKTTVKPQPRDTAAVLDRFCFHPPSDGGRGLEAL